MLSSVEQVFVGRNEKRAPLKTPAWEATYFRNLTVFYIVIPVLRTDGLSGGRSVYGHVITKFSPMGRLVHFLTHGAPLVLFACESSDIKQIA